MDRLTEDLKRMFYQVALATERKRLQLDQLKAMGERLAKSAAPAAALLIALAFTASGAWASRIIHLKDDGTYPRTREFLRCKSIAEDAIEHAVKRGKHRATALLPSCGEGTVNAVANLLEDNGYELDEEARLLNPFVLKISWEPFLSSAEKDEKVQAWWATFRRGEAEFLRRDQW